MSLLLYAIIAGTRILPAAEFQHGEGFCVLELDKTSQGTTTTFIKLLDSSDYIISFDNPSWRSLQAKSISAEFRYHQYPADMKVENGRVTSYTKIDPIEPDQIELTIAPQKDGTKKIGGFVDRDFLRFLASRPKNKMKFGLYYEGKALTDYQPFTLEYLAALDQCTDPFAK